MPGAAAAALRGLHAGVRSCVQCPLHRSRTRAVPGEGDLEARLMLVGEAPGAQEDEQGRPFCGAAGEVLDRVLGEPGLAREKMFITSSVKCRPPGNRNPRGEELAMCRRLWLEPQIRLIDPALIVLLGKVAVELMLGVRDNLRDVHGQVHECDGRRYLLTYHPAAVLYSPLPEAALREDFRRIPRLLSTTPEEG